MEETIVQTSLLKKLLKIWSKYTTKFIYFNPHIHIMVKFGLILHNGWRLDLPKYFNPHIQWNIIVKEAKLAEELGFDGIWIWDHFHTHPVAKPGWSVFECWTTLSALAPITKRVRLGQIVTCVLYRSPAYLAKVSSVVDVISNGRVELGLGACWYLDEFNGYGYSFPRARDRIFMLDEAIQVIKLMWTQPKAYFNGKYFKLNGALNDPKPIQKPHPPILIGGGGEKYTLKVAAKHANKWDLFGGTPEIYEHKLEVLYNHCENIGRNFNEIIKTHSLRIIIGENMSVVKDRFKQVEEFIQTGKSFKEISNWPFIGTYDKIIDSFQKYIDLGVSEFILSFRGPPDFKQLREFAEKIMPSFK